jgi:hypothetical protein
MMIVDAAHFQTDDPTTSPINKWYARHKKQYPTFS